jgi:hypothetical protein
MIDLTSKSADEINLLIQKYTPVLELVKETGHIPHLAYIFELGVNYIKGKYNELETKWKQWSVVCLKDFQINGVLKGEEDVFKFIDEFVEYCRIHYQLYVDDIALFSNEYERDRVFVQAFINMKTGSRSSD